MADTKKVRPFEVTHRLVLAIAAPMTLAFLTTPILGFVDTAVVGQFGDAALIGGLAIGAILFDIVFATFNFVRSGTTAFVAQALGREDRTEQQAVFFRAVILAVVLGVGLLLLSPWILKLGLWFMAPGEEVAGSVRAYFTIRILAAPFSLVNYAILGVLLGQGRSLAGLMLQTFLNGLNMVLSVWFGLSLGWGLEGVAWGTVIGEIVTAALGLAWLLRGFDAADRPSRAQVLDRSHFRELLVVNGDIMVRSFALLAAFSFFTRTGAQLGAIPLAANAILMKFFMIAGYYLDGFATAAEQIVGRSVGARYAPAFWHAVRLTTVWGFGLAAITAVVILLAGETVIGVMTTSSEIRDVAAAYLPWAAATPLAGVLAFQLDGVFIGATWSRDMRNMMLLSLAVFVALIYLLLPGYANHGLWLALNLFLALRGLSLATLLPRRASALFSG